MRTLACLLLAAALGAATPADEYAALLKRVVKRDGVDYAGLKKGRAALDAHVSSLKTVSAGASDGERIAFWINAYNALTLQQVLDTRPASGRYSVKEIDGFWTRRKWTVAGRRVSLDEIEHKILREKFSEARIHFALNCASRSCPPLAPELYRADTLDVRLSEAARAYLADQSQNSFDQARKRAEVSELFRWFKSDFVDAIERPVPGIARLQQFLAEYAPTETLRRRLLSGRWTVRYKPYDWSLNLAGAVVAEEKTKGGSPLLWIYLVPMTLLLLYGLNAFRILVLRRRRGPEYEARLEAIRSISPLGRSEFPVVCVQLPIYNEGEIAARVIEAAGSLDWPRGRLELQVLDDSTDQTVGIVDRAARLHGARVLRRTGREGFKAGALAAGLQATAAQFIAVFDADFVPGPDFLRRALAHFSDAGVGCVQGRWAHLNREQNWLTRAQAIGLDAHFRVVQFTRAATASFCNFMGTAGVWRRSAIEEAGGWSADTLTEDLDLSYRAQLAGWRIVVDRDLAVLSEIPPTIGAYKSQQRRWACGSMQCARKHLPAVWRAKLPFALKLDATLHLCGYSACTAMALLAFLVPFVELPPLWFLGLAGVGPLAISFAGQRRSRPGSILAFFLLGVGVCANSAVAVFRGLIWPIETFVRTPKQGDRARPDPAPAPRLEQAMAVVTLALAGAMATRSAAAMAGYAFFFAAGFWLLATYWWIVERRRGAP